MQRAIASEGSPEYRAFGERYFDDLGGFMRDCVIWPEENGRQGPAPYQVEIGDRLVSEMRVSARGIHGLGKTRIAAVAVHWFALTREAMEMDWLAITTASAWAQLRVFLWPEIHVVARTLNWEAIGRPRYTEGSELLMRDIHLRYGQATALASNDHAKMEGAHAPQMLFVFDEAKSIPDATWDAMEGAFSQSGEGMIQKAYVLAISTPADPMGRFYQIHSQAKGYTDWWVRHVKKEEAVAAGRVAQEWIDNRRTQWGEDSIEFQNRVEGEFSKGRAGGLITLDRIKHSNEQHAAWEARGRTRLDGKPSVVTDMGGDGGGGREGNEASTIALVYDGHIVGDLLIYEQAEDQDVAIMELAGKIDAYARKYPNAFLTIDGLGIGAGALHWLRMQGKLAIGFMAGNATEMEDEDEMFGFVNWRAAGWYGLRYLLGRNAAPSLWLPENAELQQELLAMRAGRTKYTRGVNRRAVIGKDDVRADIGRSTDLADAIIHAIMGPHLAAADARQEQYTRVRQSDYSIGDY